MTEHKRKTVAQRTIEALKSLAECDHDWVVDESREPGSYKDQFWFDGFYKCVNCGARRNTCSRMKQEPSDG